MGTCPRQRWLFLLLFLLPPPKTTKKVITVDKMRIGDRANDKVFNDTIIKIPTTWCATGDRVER